MKYVLNILIFACAIMVMHDVSSASQDVTAHMSGGTHVMMVASAE